ncbi:DUF1540 domain-containing protein [Pontibacillus salicampi]|uniref:DUF1540 domain-containing protein n=1 Tax=Pontibacillus salicampi TaxID=1449801 RepID=A0ABV6LKB1_9BACI
MEVLCEVANCVYNLEGEKCGASEISIISEVGKTASSQQETDCQTFEPQEN